MPRVIFDEIVKQTKKGLRVRFDDNRVWIPLSQIRKEDLSWHILDLPDWLIREKGIEAARMDKRSVGR